MKMENFKVCIRRKGKILMKQKGAEKIHGVLMILFTLIVIAAISFAYVAAAPPDLITVTIHSGDSFTAKLDEAAGGDRSSIASLKIVTNGYSLSSADFGSLKSMATNGAGRLTYLDLQEAACAYNQIPDGAFDNTGNNIILQKILLPNSITDIGNFAFYNCSGLTGGLNLPNGITSIGGGAFYNCSGLTGSLNLPNSLIGIGNIAFSRCSGLTGSLILPANLEQINPGAFFGCSGFSSLTIPNGVLSIGSDAFNGCSGFTGSLTIPDSVTSIDYNAFRDCSGFTGSLTIPAGITGIAEMVFANCSGFTGNLVIPNGVTSIGNGAFEGCSGFKGKLNIPDSVTSIGYYAFYGCSGFTGSLTTPGSVTGIDFYAFYGCSGFTGSLIISDGVTSIGYGAFYGCSGLTGNLIIPESVTSIADYAFAYCSGFTGNLSIPAGITCINPGVFGYCNGFTGNLHIPDSVTTISNDAFSDCSGFTSLTIPDSVTSIGDFAFSNCTGLAGSLAIPGNITRIGNYTFYNCSGFTGSLVIPGGVTEIGPGAFASCSGFSGSLTIPDGVTTIGASAFNGCGGLTGNLHIPDSVTTIGAYAFRDCIGLTGSLYISKNITSIDVCPFFALPVASVTYHGSGITDLDLTNWFETACNINTTLTTLDFANAAAMSISANGFPNLASINFSGMTNLRIVSINAGQIDFSGGVAGGWYADFDGMKNICCQRPAVVATQKTYPLDNLGFNSVFTVPAPIWLTAYNIPIADAVGSGWFDPSYADEISYRPYDLVCTAPDGNGEANLDTTKPGIHTVRYSFSEYPGESYSRQYSVLSESDTFCTVSFNSNSGTDVSSQSVKYNAKAMEPVAPTRTGYTFAGWYSDSGLTVAFNFASAITADITLYAKWNPIKVMITSDQVLSESWLDQRSIKVTLLGTAFSTSSPSGFIMNSTISNLGIKKITYVDNRHCTIDLAYTGTTGIGYNTDLRVTIPGSQLTTGNDLTSNALTISADLISGKTTGTYLPGTNSDLLTATNSRNEYSTYWNGATLYLGKGTTGWNTDGWLYFPNVIGSINTSYPGYQVDRAELVLKLTGFAGAAYLPRRIKVYMITDPDGKGNPYFGSTDGFRTGLNFSYRDNRTGKDILWKTGAANILEMLGSGEPLDVYEFLPQDYGQGFIKLDVTAALRAWQSGSPNQGLYIVAESDLPSGDPIHICWRESTDVKPYLQLVYAQTIFDCPVKVTNLSAQSTADSVTLQWNPSGQVRLLRKTGAAPCDPEDGTLVYEGAGSSFTDEGLEQDQAYYYAIFAYDSNRTYSPRAWVKAITGEWTLVPAAPSDLSFTGRSATTITLSWLDNSANETGFVIERWNPDAGWTRIATLPAGQTAYQDYGLQPNTLYEYQVGAINPIGSSAYIYGYDTTGNELIAPEKLVCKIVSYSQVRLEWTDSPNETGYRIQVLNSSGSVVKTISNITQNANNYLVTGLTANTKYRFKVIAIRGSETAASDATEVITTPPKITSGIL